MVAGPTTWPAGRLKRIALATEMHLSGLSQGRHHHGKICPGLPPAGSKKSFTFKDATALIETALLHALSAFRCRGHLETLAALSMQQHILVFRACSLLAVVGPGQGSNPNCQSRRYPSGVSSLTAAAHPARWQRVAPLEFRSSLSLPAIIVHVVVPVTVGTCRRVHRHRFLPISPKAGKLV